MFFTSVQSLTPLKTIGCQNNESSYIKKQNLSDQFRFRGFDHFSSTFLIPFLSPLR